jgi:hypothetical protein
MKTEDHVLCFVVGPDGELFIHADAKGMDILENSIKTMQTQLTNNDCPHDHLFSTSWGGGDLTEKQGIQTGTLIQHVKIFGWNEEWAQKHGFKNQGPPNQAL